MLDTPDQWWQQRMVKSGTDFAMTDPMYLDLVSRYVFEVLFQTLSKVGHR